MTQATLATYRDANIPQLFTSTATELTAMAGGNGFRLVANDTLQARAIGAFASDTLKAASVALIREDSAYGNPIAKAVAATLLERKKAITADVKVDLKASEFNEFINGLKGNRPDAVVAVVRDNQLLPLMAQMKQAGLSDVPVIAPNVGKTRKVSTAPPDVEKLYVSSSCLEPVEFHGGKDFLGKFRQTYKAEPVWAAHYAYDAVYVLADTIRRTGSINGARLRAKLANIDPSAPVTNTMRFEPNGEQRYGTIAIYQRRNGAWESLMRSDTW